MTSTQLTPTRPPRVDDHGLTTPPRHSSASQTPRRRRFVSRLAGDPADPRWVRPSLFALLFSTAVAYLYNLSASGMGNSFYAAAVQAGTKSWKAFFFGSFDSSNYITVDKPPASLWVMEISGRLFGFSSWSMLAPQAIEGVLAVALLYGAVRRVSGPAAGLAAGVTLALTPAAALMFRFNNPDAFLVLLLVAGGYLLVRALQSGSTKWLALAGACVGFGFITKMGQALLVVPAFGLAYLIAGPPRLAKRIGQLLVAGVSMVVAAGWWIAIVELTPTADRPYIGGSTDNNILNLAFGYNGFGRLFGGSGNGGGGGGGGNSSGGFGGATGVTRLFDSEMGLQISWLLPAALIALAAGLWMTRKAPRIDLTRAALVLWGGWLVVTGLVFSYMQGTIHPYYTVALAPAIAALVATTGVLVWRDRTSATAQATGVAMMMSTGLWSYHLLDETPSWYPALRFLSIGMAILGSAALVADRWHARTAIVAAVAAGTVLLSGGGAYALATTSVAHSGSIPNVGSASAASGMGGGGGFGGGARSGTAPSGTAPGNSASAATGAKNGGGSGTPPTGSGEGNAAANGVSTGGQSGEQGGEQSSGQSDNTALIALLKASTTKWAAAASSSMTAGPLELSSGKAVMSVGGFTGSDNAITLAQFEALVKAGQIHYLIAGSSGGGGGMGGGSVFTEITTWVAAHYKAITVGGETVYDLTTAKT